ALVDLVITVDTSVVHLAGALGRPTFVLVPFCPDWRWMLARADSPWYPTVRLFRQPAVGDWESVIARIADAVRALYRGFPQSFHGPSCLRFEVSTAVAADSANRAPRAAGCGAACCRLHIAEIRRIFRALAGRFADHGGGLCWPRDCFGRL